MTKADNNYSNSKIYFPQGADRLGIDSDGLFDFYGDTLTGERLRTELYANGLTQEILTSGGVLSTLNFPSAGTVFITPSAGATNMSAWLTSCLQGAKLRIAIRLGNVGGVSTGSVYVSLSGVSLVGLANTDLSSISLQNSDGSAAYVDLLATADNEWSVIHYVSSKVAERISA